MFRKFLEVVGWGGLYHAIREGTLKFLSDIIFRIIRPTKYYKEQVEIYSEAVIKNEK